MSEKVSNRKIILMSTDPDVVACADRDRLQQVLINLVENAIKYSAPRIRSHERSHSPCRR